MRDGLEGRRGERRLWVVVGLWDRGGSRWWEQWSWLELLGFSCHLVACPGPSHPAVPSGPGRWWGEVGLRYPEHSFSNPSLLPPFNMHVPLGTLASDPSSHGPGFLQVEEGKPCSLAPNTVGS